MNKIEVKIENIPYTDTSTYKTTIYEEAVDKIEPNQSLLATINDAQTVRNVMNKKKYENKVFKSKKEDQHNIRFFRLS
jgi:hypothetical protein